MADIAFPTAKVVFRAAAIAQDSDDSGSIPQEILLGGIRVTLIPSLKYVEVAAPPGGVNPTTYSLRTWNLITTNDGNLINMDDPEEEVLIVASDAFPGYVVSWKSVIEDPSGTLPPIIKRWLAPAGSIVDLTTVISVLPNNPNPIADYLQAVYDAREARDNAISASESASSSASEAQTAKDDAEIARGAAQMARDDALQAKAQAVAAKEAAATSADAAASSASEAQTAKDDAATAKNDAETSRGAAASSASEAQTAKDDAVAAKNDAETSRGAAATSAQVATQAKADAETARDKAIQAAVYAATTAAAALPEFDTAAGEYDPASLDAWITRQCDGQIYGVQIPKGLATACTKTAANAGIATPIPGVIGTPAIDPYRDKGPFFYRKVNGYVTTDGVPHVTAFDGDATFSQTGSNGDVWILAPNLYWRFSDDGADSVTISISDVSRPGFAEQPKGKLPDGTRRPYMLYAKYALSIVDGTARSISGQPPANLNVSHNSLITQCKNATTGYSGKSYADDWYMKVMFLLKYATKNSQSVFAGCTSHSQQYAPSVAESNVTRVLVTTAQAAQFPIGSAVMLGTNVPTTTDRQAAQIYNVIPTAKIVSKEIVGANVALNLDLAAPITTATTQLLSTAPWWTGGCDGVVGDGSPVSNTSNREPFVLQGVELGLGLNEILGDVILNSNGSTGWRIYSVPDSKNAATAVTANYTDSGKTLPAADETEGWKYTLYPDDATGLLFGAGVGANQSTGLCDGSYTINFATTGNRLWRSLGSLVDYANAGLWYASGKNDLASPGWHLGSRLSANGRAS